MDNKELAHLLECVEHDKNMGHDTVLVEPSFLLEALTELRERRAADLTDEERDALRFAQQAVVMYGVAPDKCAEAWRVLDKLLKEQG